MVKSTQLVTLIMYISIYAFVCYTCRVKLNIPCSGCVISRIIIGTIGFPFAGRKRKQKKLQRFINDIKY